MSKKTFILFFLLFFVGYTHAQTDSVSAKTTNKMIISVAGGVAIPTGVISLNNSNNSTNQERSIAGDLSKGYYGKLEFFYSFSENSGASAMIFSSINKAIPPKDINPYHVITDGTGPCCVSVNVESYGTKTWYTNSFLIGLYREINFHELTLNFKISGGMMNANSPESYMYFSGYNYDVHLGPTYHYNDFTMEVTQPSESSYNFAGYAGIDLSLNVSKRVKVKIGLDELLSFFEFNGEQTFVSDTHNGNGSITHNEETKRLIFDKNISLFCYNAGISFVIK